MATILVNANIYQQRGQFAQAMLIEEGFIQAVGSNRGDPGPGPRRL